MTKDRTSLPGRRRRARRPCRLERDRGPAYALLVAVILAYRLTWEEPEDDAQTVWLRLIEHARRRALLVILSEDRLSPSPRSRPERKVTVMIHPFEDDGALARDVADALQATRPLTDVVAARATPTFTWRTIDDDLLAAELMFDSAQAVEPALSRGDADASGWVLVFTAQLRSVEVEVLTDRVVGQLIPPSPGEVDVQSEGGVVASVPVDDLGFFVIEPVPVGVVRLRCTTPTTRLVTDWVRL
ncbi:MAG: hypothetical protein ACXV1K_00070 [Kineosporiaceae bacterium]